MSVTYFSEPQKLNFRQGENDALELHMDGQVIPLSPPKRALPLSEPNRFIVLYDADRKELGMLCDIEDLESESKAALQKVLEKVYYIRHITRIIEINKEPATGQTRWRVELENEEENKGASSLTENGDGNSNDNNHHNIGTNGHNTTANIGGVLLNKLNLNKDGLNGNGNGKASSRSVGEEVEFCIKGPEDVQTARYPYIFLVDVDGNRYDIPDCDALDLDSRRCSEGFL